MKRIRPTVTEAAAEHGRLHVARALPRELVGEIPAARESADEQEEAAMSQKNVSGLYVAKMRTIVVDERHT